MSDAMKFIEINTDTLQKKEPFITPRLNTSTTTSSVKIKDEIYICANQKALPEYEQYYAIHARNDKQKGIFWQQNDAEDVEGYVYEQEKNILEFYRNGSKIRQLAGSENDDYRKFVKKAKHFITLYREHPENFTIFGSVDFFESLGSDYHTLEKG